MIYDYLENLSSYEQIIPWLDVISDFLEDEDLAALPDGKTIISGDDLFVSIQSYETKDAESAEYEAHEKYADLQMILSGDGELCGVSIPASGMSVTVPYDADKDICFGTVDSEGWIPLTQGKFVILMPSDAHKPGIHLDNETSKVVRKAVFKIKLQQ